MLSFGLPVNLWLIVEIRGCFTPNLITKISKIILRFVDDHDSFPDFDKLLSFVEEMLEKLGNALRASYNKNVSSCVDCLNV